MNYEGMNMPQKYTEENGRYTIDCSEAAWSSNSFHEYSQKYTNSLLCDVDFVIEDTDCVLLVEYKNAKVRNAPEAKAFNPLGDDKLNNVARKFYDSSHILNLMGRMKPRKYVYVIEYDKGDSTSRKALRNRLKNRLPFRLQSNIGDGANTMITDIDVVNIEEWNDKREYSKFPIASV